MGLYDLEVVSLQEHYFQMGGLAYDTNIKKKVTNMSIQGTYISNTPVSLDILVTVKFSLLN